jgi:hypothetical protein
MMPKISEKPFITDYEMDSEKIVIDIPKSDLKFFFMFADKLGWQYSTKQKMWDEYIKSSPKDVDISDDEIMDIVREVRYGKR